MSYPILAPSSTWYKGTTPRATITRIDIVDSYTITGNEIESWNADVDDSGNIKCYITDTILTIVGNGSGKIAMNQDSSYSFSMIYKQDVTTDYFSSLTTINGANLLDTSACTNMSYMFESCKLLTSIDVSGFITNNVEYMQSMFCNCRKIQSLNVSSWNTSNVIDMNTMFSMCISLTTLDVSGWDIGKVQYVYQLFAQCTSIKQLDLSNWNFSNVKSTRHMFANCYNLTSIGDISGWNTSSCTHMHYMFANCSSISNSCLQGVSNWDTKNVINMNSMFMCGDGTNNNGAGTLTALDLSKWDVSSCTDMGFMFWGQHNLTELNITGWDTSNVTSFHHTFSHCRKLSKIHGIESINVSNARHLNAMFNDCNAIEKLDLSSYNTTNCYNFGQMFEKCYKLKELKGLNNWDTSNGRNFSEMFAACYELEELDLSSFDTRNADKNWIDDIRNESTSAMFRFFGIESVNADWVDDMPLRKLKRLILGKNFSFDGNGNNHPYAAVLHTPDKNYLPYSDGYWYTADGSSYLYSEIPNLTREEPTVYYTSHPRAEQDLILKYVSLKRIGNSVRNVKGETSKNYTIDEMVDEISKFVTEDKIISTDLEYDNSNATKIGNGTFYGMSNLASVNAPNVTEVEANAFYDCANLTTVNLPALKILRENAFRNCAGLTSINIPAIQVIDRRVFHSCRGLTGEITFPNLTTISTQAFTSTNFSAMHFPALTTIGGGWTFQGCLKLETITLPLVTTIPEACFMGSGARMLKRLDLPKVTKINAGAFRGQGIEALILRAETMCVITENETVFLETPIASGTGFIYVPAALVDTYKADTMWSIFANQIRAIEDYPDICG